MPKTKQPLILIAGSLFVLSLAALLLTKRSTAPEGPSATSANRPLSALKPSSSGIALKQEVGTLTVDEVLAQLPEEAYRFGLWSAEENPRADLLFKRLGELLGSKALDEIVGRYGDNAFSAYAMGKALAGWMAADPTEASEALLQLARGVERHDGKKDGLGYDYVTIGWGGRSLVIIEGGDYFDLGGKSDVNPHGQLSLGAFFEDALRAATRADEDLGFSLLADESLQHQFYQLVPAFTDGLGTATDWLEIARKLDDLDRSTYKTSIPDALARAWARSDIDAALTWYIERIDQGGSNTQNLTVSLLQSLEDRGPAVDWLERNLDEGFVTVETLEKFAAQIRSAEIDGSTQQLVALPSDEKSRARIVSMFAMPHYDGGERRLRHPPESLNALIEAADLSPKLASYWKSTVESGIYIDKEN